MAKNANNTALVRRSTLPFKTSIRAMIASVLSIAGARSRESSSWCIPARNIPQRSSGMNIPPPGGLLLLLRKVVPSWLLIQE